MRPEASAISCIVSEGKPFVRPGSVHPEWRAALSSASLAA